MSQSYLMNASISDVFTSQIFTQNTSSPLMSSKVMDNTEKLLDQLKTIDFKQSLNIFCFAIQNFSQIAQLVAQLAIQKSQLVSVQSGSQLVINNDLQEFQWHLPQQIAKKHGEIDVSLNLSQVITNQMYFNEYYQIFKKSCKLQQEEQPRDQVCLLKFTCVQQDDVITNINLIYCNSGDSSLLVQQIAYKLHCFDWEELNRYKQFITSKQMVDGQDDFDLITKSQTVKSTQQYNWIKKIIVKHAGIYIANTENIIQKMSQTRTEFDFEEPSKARIFYYDQILKNFNLKPDLYYTISQPNDVIELLSESQLLLKLNLKLNFTTIDFELKEYCEKLKPASFANSDPRLAQVTDLISRNQTLIKQMYKRLVQSERVYNAQLSQEQQTRQQQADHLLSILNQQDQYTQIFMKQQKEDLKYQNALNELAYQNQLLEIDPLNFKSLNELIHSFINTSKKQIVENESKCVDRDVRRAIDSQVRTLEVLKNKYAELVDGCNTLQFQYFEVKKELQKAPKRTNSIGVVNTSEIKPLIKQLTNFVKNVQITDFLDIDQKKTLFKLRGIEQKIIEINASGMNLNPEIHEQLKIFRETAEEFMDQKDLGWARIKDVGVKMDARV
ncbi:Conserved_hypothetical protein [Hexamita inflata]|uniref:Uncharacterized protein n=1 Tax=Hexamita inflata TaxID=28002 RepID=A0AA86QAR0_9EUKA|nr:Conserved hypothetical protein [Hexamita inflata]